MPRTVKLNEIVKFDKLDVQFINLKDQIKMFWTKPSVSVSHLKPLECAHAAIIVPKPGLRMFNNKTIHAVD